MALAEKLTCNHKSNFYAVKVLALPSSSNDSLHPLRFNLETDSGRLITKYKIAPLSMPVQARLTASNLKVLKIF